MESRRIDRWQTASKTMVSLAAARARLCIGWRGRAIYEHFPILCYLR